MGLIARSVRHLPHHYHIAAVLPSPASGPGWLPVLLVAIAIFAGGLWWVRTRS